MNKFDRAYCNGQVIQQCTTFAPASNAAESMSIFCLNLTKPMPFQNQLDMLLDAWNQWRRESAEQRPVFLRFFLSDIANQEHLIDTAQFAQCAYSIVQQPPLTKHTKIAIWCYSLSDSECEQIGNLYAVRHSAYTHYWTGNRSLTTGDSEHQTVSLLKEYEKELRDNGLTFEDACIRTWFLVQNIDTNYQGVVEGRKRNFNEIGLTEKTHYVTSTGIEGRTKDPRSLVLMDAYSVKGLRKDQIQFLYAKSHLNSTYEYGVTFERGTKVKYGDRSHIFISGTASIDNQGKVLHQGDITGQTERMLENIDMLLKEASATFTDVAMAIIYLRDIADMGSVEAAFTASDKCDIPRVFVHAPVCRPSWLVEMECIAIIPESNPSFPNF